jgi:tripartite-type tricarboxylate transporter receptor subunit TctC
MVSWVLKRLYPVVAAFFLLTLGSSAAYAQKAFPFWQGRTIRLVVAFTSGSSYDLIARVSARELPKYLPGVKSVIVQNMPGGGGLLAASHIYHRAAPDGLTIGLLNRASPIDQLVRPETVKTADFRHFRYLGSPLKDIPVLAIRKETGVRTMDELISSKQRFIPATSAKAAAGYKWAFALQKAWNLPFSGWVFGYAGQPEQVAAMQRGENDLVAATADTFAAIPLLPETTNPLVVVAQERDHRFPNVPTVFEVARRYPPDPKYWPLVGLWVNVSEWGRPFALSPRTSEDDLRVLRDIFAKVFKDGEFISRAEKMGLSIDRVAGEKQEGLIRQALNPSADVLELLKLYE